MVIFTLLLCFLTCDAEAQINDTPHYNIVAEYIRSLGAVHKIQQTANNEDQEDKDNPIKKMMSAIRTGTRFKLELNSSINVLKRMNLDKPFEELIPNTIYFYKQKIELFEEVVNISKIFVDGVPKPDVDYAKIVGRMPEITAQIEYIDESIFQSMVLVFALLIWRFRTKPATNSAPNRPPIPFEIGH